MQYCITSINTKNTHTYVKTYIKIYENYLKTEDLKKFISSIVKLIKYFKGCVHYIFASVFC